MERVGSGIILPVRRVVKRRVPSFSSPIEYMTLGTGWQFEVCGTKQQSPLGHGVLVVISRLKRRTIGCVPGLTIIGSSLNYPSPWAHSFEIWAVTVVGVRVNTYPDVSA